MQATTVRTTVEPLRIVGKVPASGIVIAYSAFTNGFANTASRARQFLTPVEPDEDRVNRVQHVQIERVLIFVYILALSDVNRTIAPPPLRAPCDGAVRLIAARSRSLSIACQQSMRSADSWKRYGNASVNGPARTISGLKYSYAGAITQLIQMIEGINQHDSGLYFTHLWH